MNFLRVSIVVLAFLATASMPGRALAQSLTADIHTALNLVHFEPVSIDVPAAGDSFSVEVELEGVKHVIHLGRRSVRADGYQLLVQDRSGGLTAQEPGPVPTLFGRVDGEKSARVAGGVLDGALYLLVELDADRRYWIEPLFGRVPGATLQDHVVYTSDDVGYWGECGGGSNVFGGAIPFGGVPCGGDHCLAQLACDADVEFFQDSGSSISRTQSRIEIIVHLANNVFEREASITHQITATLVRTAQPDPYTVTESVALLGQVAAEWGPGTHGGITRDVVHMFTGRDVDGTVIGRAYEAAVCDDEFGMGFSQSPFSMNMASISDLTTHELGHNWGADHCTCDTPPYTMNPSITAANRFHPTATRPEITAHRSSRTCLAAQRVNDFCSAALEICPGTISGSTTASTNSFSIGCGNNANLDTWYLYRPAVSGIASIHTNGSSLDTVLAVWNGCLAPGPSPLICDDNSGLGNASHVTLNVLGGETYLIQIAGNNNVSGSFVLTIEGPPCVTPFHDDCADAWTIGPGEFLGTTDGATDDGDSSCGASLISPDVWFCYVPQSDGIVVADTCDSVFDTVLSVFTDCPLLGGIEIACNDDSGNACGSSTGDLQSRVELTATANTTYYFRLSGHFGVRGAYRFRLSGPQARHDACATPLAIPLGTSYHSLVGSTPSTLSPGCGSNGSADAFFVVLAPANGLLVVTTCGTNDLFGVDSGVDTVLALYTSCGSTAIRCNDDAAASICFGSDIGAQRDSQVSTQVTAGSVRIIRVAAFSGTTPSPFVLNVGLVPENDLCANALTIGAGTHYGDLQFATVNGGTSCATVTGPDVHYRFTAPFPGRVVVTTCGTHDFSGVDTGTDTVLSLFSSSCSGFVSEFDCNSNWNAGASYPNACSGGLDTGLGRDAAVSMVMNAGQTVRIRVAAAAATTPGPFLLNIFMVPTNDLCLDATPLTEGTHFGSLAGATNQGTTPCLPAHLAARNDVWFTYTAVAAGTLFVNTCGTSDLHAPDLGIDTNLTIFSANCGGAVGIFDCNDNYSTPGSLDPLACQGIDEGLHRDAATRVSLTAGQTVRIRLAQTTALAPPFPAGGIYQLNVSFVEHLSFRRGDCNGDGTANIADSVTLLSWLFPTGTPPTLGCLDACDANDDGVLNIADVVAALAALFSAPPVPLPPPVNCGVDPTPDDGLICGTSSCP